MDAGARVIHVDVMDGHFVPPISIGALIVDALRDLVHERGGVLDVHLMVERPERRIEDSPRPAPIRSTVHWEATPHVHYALQAVRAAASTSVWPSTLPRRPRWWPALADDLDHVLCMTVNPGWGGRPYIESSTAKVARLRELLGPTCRSRWTAASTPRPARVTREAGATLFVAARRSSAPATRWRAYGRSRRRAPRARIAA